MREDRNTTCLTARATSSIGSWVLIRDLWAAGQLIVDTRVEKSRSLELLLFYFIIIIAVDITYFTKRLKVKLKLLLGILRGSWLLAPSV